MCDGRVASSGDGCLGLPHPATKTLSVLTTIPRPTSIPVDRGLMRPSNVDAVQPVSRKLNQT